MKRLFALIVAIMVLAGCHRNYYAQRGLHPTKKIPYFMQPSNNKTKFRT